MQSNWHKVKECLINRQIDDLGRISMDFNLNAVPARTENGAGLLFHAMGHSQIDVRMTELLLKKGADPNMRDDFGNTPVHNAVKYGYDGILEALLKNGGDLYRKNAKGERPIDHIDDFKTEAARRRTREIIDYFRGGFPKMTLSESEALKDRAKRSVHRPRLK